MLNNNLLRKYLSTAATYAF